MRIVILRSAIEDLVRGREFYAKQGEGLGDYFDESLAADIESLHLYAGIHAMVHGYYRMLSGKFPYAGTAIAWRYSMTRRRSLTSFEHLQRLM